MLTLLKRLVRFVVIMSLIVGVLAGTALVVTPEVRQVVSRHRSDHERIDLSPLAERSLIYDRNGKLMATLIDAQNTNRSQVPLARVPTTVTGPILAVEDEHFYSHKGINLRSIIRAATSNIDQGKISQGGSTITQQLVKNAVVGNERSLSRKIREAVLSLELEKQMTKRQILERYVNTVYFGNGAYGVQSAAQVYFNKDVSQLDWAEGALLASLIRSPQAYDPLRHPSVSLRRRDLVFRRLVETGRLTAAQVAFYRLVPLPTVAHQPHPVDDYFVDEVKKQLLQQRTFNLGATYAARKRAVFGGGLRVYTTMDPNAQLLALQARNQTVPGGRSDGTFPLPGLNPRTGRPNFGTQSIVSVEPSTGAIRVMVGGPGFAQFPFNLATQSANQPGSSMKTFVLTTLFENGFVPDDSVSGGGCTIKVKGRPPQFVAGSGGTDSITGQTERSSNCAFLRLGQVAGIPRVIDMAHRMGITTELHDIANLPLGTSEVLTRDMAAAYSVLANDGVRNPAYVVERIENSSGKVLYQHEARPERIVQSQTARLVTQVLAANVEAGTGTRAQLSTGQPAAGKTGTTNNATDVWFVGYTPQLCTAIWMGGADANVPMTFDGQSAGGVTGGRFPAATWGAYMGALLANSPPVPFIDPAPTRSGQFLQPPVDSALGAGGSQ